MVKNVDFECPVIKKSCYFIILATTLVSQQIGTFTPSLRYKYGRAMPVQFPFQPHRFDGRKVQGAHWHVPQRVDGMIFCVIS